MKSEIALYKNYNMYLELYNNVVECRSVDETVILFVLLAQTSPNLLIKMASFSRSMFSNGNLKKVTLVAAAAAGVGLGIAYASRQQVRDSSHCPIQQPEVKAEARAKASQWQDEEEDEGSITTSLQPHTSKTSLYEPNRSHSCYSYAT